ncbi:hypothetical protein E2C01_085397 [Portunus trituberculatus]|uniref:Uncharacterized protein n=1 Tax=Portunus trituberculatus TaxID=210409 RepID=A0A5B7J0V5_PORTR|nr:hypothetical protein [Portunus trituberculatus]
MVVERGTVGEMSHLFIHGQVNEAEAKMRRNQLEIQA